MNFVICDVHHLSPNFVICEHHRLSPNYFHRFTEFPCTEGHLILFSGGVPSLLHISSGFYHGSRKITQGAVDSNRSNATEKLNICSIYRP